MLPELVEQREKMVLLDQEGNVENKENVDQLGKAE